MSDPVSAPGPGPAAPKRARTRPAYVPNQESPASARLRKRLLLWMGIASVVMLGIIGVRVIQKFSKGERSVVNAKEQADAIYDKAREVQREIIVVQRKAADAKDGLTEKDFEPVKTSIKGLEDAEADLRALLDLIHAKGLDEMPAQKEIVRQWTHVQFWILDATDFLDSAKAAPAYGGFNIRLARLRRKAENTHDSLKKMELQKETLQNSPDPSVRKGAIARLKELADDFGTLAEECGLLEDYVKKGLEKPELTANEIPDLEPLREESAKATMGLKQARELRSTIAP